MGRVARMLCTVSTIKDTRANLEQFVERNLVSGADHMFIFLDDDNEDAYAFLGDHPHVTTIRTDDGYWAGDKPVQLNRRQTVNANLINCLLSPLESVDWLAHLDGDECLDIDKPKLMHLGQSIRSVQLDVLEAVSIAEPTDGVQYFKKKLTAEQLALLTRLGAIDAPSNRYYFTGHLRGKAVVRPAPALRLGIHQVTGPDGEVIEPLRSDAFNVLHYDSITSAEFARKWQSHLSGGATKFRKEKLAVAAAIAKVLAEHVDEHTRQRRFDEIYERHIQDPLDLLLELGLLVRPDQQLHRYQPTAWSDQDRRAADALLAQLVRVVDKARFGRPDSMVQIMREVRAGLGSAHPRVAAAIDRLVETVSLVEAATPLPVRGSVEVVAQDL